MPAPGIGATIVFNGIPALVAQIPVRSRQAVDDAAHEIRDRASQLAPRATGSLAASVYVSNGTDSDYGQRSSEARGRNPQVVILPEITPEFVISLFGSNSGYMDVVAVAAGHGIFLELGTRHISPRPYFTPAVEVERDIFAAQMSHVADV